MARADDDPGLAEKCANVVTRLRILLKDRLDHHDAEIVGVHLSAVSYGDPLTPMQHLIAETTLVHVLVLPQPESQPTTSTAATACATWMSSPDGKHSIGPWDSTVCTPSLEDFLRAGQTMSGHMVRLEPHDGAVQRACFEFSTQANPWFISIPEDGCRCIVATIFSMRRDKLRTAVATEHGCSVVSLRTLARLHTGFNFEFLTDSAIETTVASSVEVDPSVKRQRRRKR